MLQDKKRSVNNVLNCRVINEDVPFGAGNFLGRKQTVRDRSQQVELIRAKETGTIHTTHSSHNAGTEREGGRQSSRLSD